VGLLDILEVIRYTSVLTCVEPPACLAERSGADREEPRPCCYVTMSSCVLGKYSLRRIEKAPTIIVMYITEVLTKTTRGKIAHRCILLRESYREHGKVKTRTLANLTHCPPQDVVALRWALQHKDALLSPEDSAGLRERLERDALSADDRHLLVQLLQGTPAPEQLLGHPGQPTLQAAPRQAKRKRQLVKTSRRRHRRAAGDRRSGHRGGEGLEPMA